MTGQQPARLPHTHHPGLAADRDATSSSRTIRNGPYGAKEAGEGSLAGFLPAARQCGGHDAVGVRFTRPAAHSRPRARRASRARAKQRMRAARRRRGSGKAGAALMDRAPRLRPSSAQDHARRDGHRPARKAHPESRMIGGGTDHPGQHPARYRNAADAHRHQRHFDALTRDHGQHQGTVSRSAPRPRVAAVAAAPRNYLKSFTAAIAEAANARSPVPTHRN